MVISDNHLLITTEKSVSINIDDGSNVTNKKEQKLLL